MTAWKQKIIDILVERYPSSASAATEGASVLRLSAKKLFPEFASTSPDEKESFLEACESLEKQGVLQIVWVKRTSEIWTVLGAVRTEFGKFGDILDATKKKIDQASDELAKTGTRTRQIEKRLKDFDILPDNEVQKLLET